MAPLWTFALFGLISTLVNADAIYTKNSPVIQVTANNYQSLIAQSNYTSIVEFYAPWCGHCQNLKPAYEKAARNLDGLAKVAAVNCDEELNKALCGQMGVQGFPTLKIVKPGQKKGKPIVEDYQGQRTAKGIVDAVIDKIPNHVTRLQDSTLDTWLAHTKTSAKAILFTEKGITSALVRSLAIDFLGSISIGQVRSSQEAAVAKFGIRQFPSFVLMPGPGEEPKVYSDQMNKADLKTFLSQAAEPNMDPAPKSTKPPKAVKNSKSTRQSSSASVSFSEASKAHKSSDFNDPIGASTIVLEDDMPTESPMPIVEPEEKPMVIPDQIPPITTLATKEQLIEACLQAKSGTCVLVLLPQTSGADAALPVDAAQAMEAFGEIADKHNKRQDHTFPSYGVPAENEAGLTLRGELGLKDGSSLEVIATNNKRGWWRLYEGGGYTSNDLENFIDAIRLGEGSKRVLPESFGATSVVAEAPEPSAETEPEPEATEAEASDEAEPQPVAEPEHDEL